MEIGIPELLIVLLVVIFIFGPGRIVKVAGELGAGIRQFKEGLRKPSNDEKPEEETTLPVEPE